MNRKRWQLGTQPLTYNPKSESESWGPTGEVKTTANGRTISENTHFDENMSFTFDIYNAPTRIFNTKLVEFSKNTYSDISYDDFTQRIYVLRSAGNVIDVYNRSGDLVRVVSPAGLGNILAFCFSYPNIICFWSTNELTTYDANGTYISKIIYGDTDLLNITGISRDYISGATYAITGFGKIFKLEATSTYMVQFPDYETNVANNEKRYDSITIRTDGFISLLKDKKYMMFMSGDLSIVYTVETDRETIAMFSFTIGQDGLALLESSISEARLNLAGIELEKVRKQAESGIVLLTDENNISRYFSVESIDIQRVRNMRDSRYNVTINGLLLT